MHSNSYPGTYIVKYAKILQGLNDFKSNAANKFLTDWPVPKNAYNVKENLPLLNAVYCLKCCVYLESGE